MRTDYNGWKNKATWQVNLWLGESMLLEEAQVASHVGGGLMLEAFVRGHMIQWTKDELTDNMLDAGLATVDWNELARTYAYDYETYAKVI